MNKLNQYYLLKNYNADRFFLCQNDELRSGIFCHADEGQLNQTTLAGESSMVNVKNASMILEFHVAE